MAVLPSEGSCSCSSPCSITQGWTARMGSAFSGGRGDYGATGFMGLIRSMRLGSSVSRRMYPAEGPRFRPPNTVCVAAIHKHLRDSSRGTRSTLVIRRPRYQQ